MNPFQNSAKEPFPKGAPKLEDRNQEPKCPINPGIPQAINLCLLSDRPGLTERSVLHGAQAHGSQRISTSVLQSLNAFGILHNRKGEERNRSGSRRIQRGAMTSISYWVSSGCLILLALCHVFDLQHGWAGDCCFVTWIRLP